MTDEWRKLEGRSTVVAQELTYSRSLLNSLTAFSLGTTFTPFEP